MRLERIRESEIAELALSSTQVADLQSLGSRLASRSRWWGQGDEDDEAEGSHRSVIQLQFASEGRWGMRVSDAVGLISVGDLQIEVTPKIPVAHALFLLEQGNYLPRVSVEPGSVAEGDSLWAVVARWYLNAAERLLRQGLARGYHEDEAILKTVRGTLSGLKTARRYYTGNIEFDCTYEDFTIDNPFNRVVLAALRRVAGSPVLIAADRRRARNASQWMSEVTPLRRSDLRAVLARETLRYRDALQLASHILQDEGRGLSYGQQAAWTFLIRTPEAIEAGIRTVLQRALSPRWTVRKERRRAAGSSVSFSPDLVFDGAAVGDVKYRLTSKDWERSDLYQSIAFMAAFAARQALVIGFQPTPGPAPPQVAIEGYEVSYIPWRAEAQLTPEEAAADLIRRVRLWLEEVTSSQPAPSEL